jgi:hypothetical protein
MITGFGWRWLEEGIPYTGGELSSRWVSAHAGQAGDTAALFVGRCDVATEDLVDNDDREAGATIVAARMLHVIIMHPGCDLRAAVLRQRLLACILCESLGRRGIVPERQGDDIFVEQRKLTVSIAAPSGEACLIHLGVNVDPSGAPLDAIGLDELNIGARDLGDELMTRYAQELATAAYAETKVREVD